MTSYKFHVEYETEVFLNQSGAISVLQQSMTGEEDIVVLGSKARAVAVARAILALSKVADFKTEEET